MKLLVAKSGPLAGTSYAIGARTLIGRDGDCDIQIIDSGVSRKHACVLEQDDGSVLLRDLMSHNGTILGNKLVREALLNDGDEISIGESRFQYRDAENENATTLVELKLMSGPAQDATTTVHISDIERDEMVASAKSRKSSSPPRSGAPKRASAAPCCGSPLGEQARKQGWKFCPACGRAVTS